MLMYMCMLNKRTHILLSNEDHYLLGTLAKRQNTSVGELIRIAVRKMYSPTSRLEKRRQQVNSIFSLWTNQRENINYKQLIEDGRRN